jgi:DNA invertase Pin-like site-specific DNA recombinase
MWRGPELTASDSNETPRRAPSALAWFKVIDDPSIDTRSRTGKLVMRFLALIAEIENDIRRERQMDGIAKARERGVRFGRKSLLLPETIKDIRTLRQAGATVPEIIRRTGLSKASVYRALAASAH